MAEPLSIAASIVGIGLAGVKLASSIYEVVDTLGSAKKDVESLAFDLGCFAAVVNELADIIKAPEKIHSANLTTALRDVIAQCRNIFRDLNGMLVWVKSNSRARRFRAKCLWVFRKTAVDRQRANIDSLKMTLTLMLQTLKAARRRRRKKRASLGNDRILLETLVESQVRSVLRLQKVEEIEKVDKLPHVPSRAASGVSAPTPNSTEQTQQSPSAMLLSLVTYQSGRKLPLASSGHDSKRSEDTAVGDSQDQLVTGGVRPQPATVLRAGPTAEKKRGDDDGIAQDNVIVSLDKLLLTWTSDGSTTAAESSDASDDDELDSSEEEDGAIDNLNWLESSPAPVAAEIPDDDDEPPVEHIHFPSSPFTDPESYPEYIDPHFEHVRSQQGPPRRAEDFWSYARRAPANHAGPNVRPPQFNEADSIFEHERPHRGPPRRADDFWPNARRTSVREAWTERAPLHGLFPHTLYNALMDYQGSWLWYRAYTNKHVYHTSHQFDAVYIFQLSPDEKLECDPEKFLYVALPRYLISTDLVKTFDYEFMDPENGWLYIFNDLRHEDLVVLIEHSSRLLDRAYHKLAKLKSLPGSATTENDAHRHASEKLLDEILALSSFGFGSPQPKYLNEKAFYLKPKLNQGVDSDPGEDATEVDLPPTPSQNPESIASEVNPPSLAMDDESDDVRDQPNIDSNFLHPENPHRRHRHRGSDPSEARSSSSTLHSTSSRSSRVSASDSGSRSSRHPRPPAPRSREKDSSSATAKKRHRKRRSAE